MRGGDGMGSGSRGGYCGEAGVGEAEVGGTGVGGVGGRVQEGWE